MKTILITGGTGGLGTTVVKRLARDYRCFVLYHSKSSFDALKKVVDVEGAAADLSNLDDVERAVASAGEVFALVHLVGGFEAGGIESDGWSKMMSMNFDTALNTIRAALPHIANGGRIVAISSKATLDKPKGLAPYIVAKSALNALIEIVAVECKPRGITANALLPSALATPAMLSGGSDPSKLVPTEHVADAIAWLLSDAGAHVTGTLVPLS